MSKLFDDSCSSASKSSPDRCVTLRTASNSGGKNCPAGVFPPWVNLPFHCESSGSGSSVARIGSVLRPVANSAKLASAASATNNLIGFEDTAIALQKVEIQPYIQYSSSLM